LNSNKYPDAIDFEKVGNYPAVVCAGSGCVWDEVLVYRVWCHPERGVADEEDGNDYYYCFATYDEVLEYSKNMTGAELPIALILQRERINEPEPEQYVHVKDERLTEWPVEFLSRPKHTSRTIPEFLVLDAPPNWLDILRGLAK